MERPLSLRLYQTEKVFGDIVNRIFCDTSSKQWLTIGTISLSLFRYQIRTELLVRIIMLIRE